MNILEDKPPFKLTQQDKASNLWLRLQEHFRNRLADVRAKNDAVQDEAKTATLRGEIRAIKSILALGEESPPMDGQ